MQDAPLDARARARSRRAASSAGSSPIIAAATSAADLALRRSRAGAAGGGAAALDDVAARRRRAPARDALQRRAARSRCRDLDDAELARCFGARARATSRRDDGALLSFFTGAHTHVVLRAKERACLRPHGHILRTGDRLVPDEASLTSTAWMDGVFHSLVTQGHVNINRLLSTMRSLPRPAARARAAHLRRARRAASTCSTCRRRSR